MGGTAASPTHPPRIMLSETAVSREVGLAWLAGALGLPGLCGLCACCCCSRAWAPGEKGG
jgi:hypothetical protein